MREKDCSLEPEDRDMAFIPAQIKGFRARRLITDPKKEKDAELAPLFPLFKAD